jgi:response regulator RpfG family c-di-GMP phosphodiesterase
MVNRPSPRRVAVINGSNELLGLFQSLLGSGRYQVSFLEASDHAYSRIKREQPSLVIFFLHIGDTFDFQVLSMLKLDRATEHIPVLTYVAPGDDDAEDESAPDFGESSTIASTRAARMN